MAIKPLFDATKLPPEEMNLFYARVADWYMKKTALTSAAADEIAARQLITENYFDTPREGVNKAVLGNGRMLEMDFRINRGVDEAALDAAIKGQTIHPDTVSKVIKYKAELVTKEWKDLTKEDRLLFADIVTEKPGTPGLKIITPAG